MTPAPSTNRSERAVSVPAAHATDTVKLSLSAQIHQLKSEGQSAKQSAVSLGVSADTVDSYFSVATVKTVATPAATTTPTT